MEQGSLGEELFDACASGDLARVNAALTAASADILAWRKPSSGWTPLHVAAEMGYLQIVQALVRAGAPIDARDLKGWTPLCIALDSEIDGAYQTGQQLNLAVGEFLLSIGANPSVVAFDGMTPLSLVREHGCEEATTLLTQRGAR
jgi:ankyrin repeat protein